MWKTKVAYLFFVIILSLLAVLYNQYFMMLLLLVFAVLPLPLFCFLQWSRRKIHINFGVVPHVVKKGDWAELEIEVKNVTSIPAAHVSFQLECRNIRGGQPYTEYFILSVDGFQEQTINFNIYSEYCGNLEIKIKKIRIMDFIGFWKAKCLDRDVILIPVIPSINRVELPKLNPKNMYFSETDEYSKTQSGDDSSELFSIREYQAGDRINRVHWSLSVKEDQLMVKEFSLPVDCSIVILAEFHQYEGVFGLEVFDSVLESAISLSHTMLEDHIVHYFSWYDGAAKECRCVKIESEVRLYEVITELLDLKPALGAELLMQHHNEFIRRQYTEVFYVTDHIFEDALNEWQRVRPNTVCHKIIALSNDRP